MIVGVLCIYRIIAQSILSLDSQLTCLMVTLLKGVTPVQYDNFHGHSRESSPGSPDCKFDALTITPVYITQRDIDRDIEYILGL